MSLDSDTQKALYDSVLTGYAGLLATIVQSNEEQSRYIALEPVLERETQKSKRRIRRWRYGARCAHCSTYCTGGYPDRHAYGKLSPWVTGVTFTHTAPEKWHLNFFS
jgi:hypothetical protein